MTDKELKVIAQPATIADLPHVLEMIHSLSQWLKTKGVHQWSDSFPIHILEDEVSKQELFVLRLNDSVIASVAIGKDSGELWDDRDDAASYLHRLAIRRDHSGVRLGEKMMTWAEDEMLSRGFQKLRLVCDAANPVLIAYYSKLGYAAVGVKHYAPYNMDFALFEKVLG